MRKLFKIFLLLSIFSIVIYSCIMMFSPQIYLYHPNQIEVYNQKQSQSYSLINNSMSKYTVLEDISEEFLQTIITVEDKRFFQHNGLDFLRIGKSFIINTLDNQISQGGSTITQQLAKLAFLDNSKTYLRKLKEAFLSLKIESKYTKKQILEMYINNCYFSHNIYGIQLASNYYFNKDPIDLNYSESSMLVGIINAPNIYAPDINYEESIKKQQQILFTLYQNNIIDSNQYYQELNRPLNLYCQIDKNNYNLMYYQQGIEKELIQLGVLNDNLLRQGYKINSNIDFEVYNQINPIIKKYQNSAKNGEIAVVIMKPYSNKVLALWGGFNYLSSSYNRAIESQRQIGSTVKPFLYYLGLINGMTPLTKLMSEETTFNIEGIGLYSPKNASSFYANRPINMIEALSLSDNIYAIKTTLLLGSKTLSNLFSKFNITIENVNPTIGLGSFSLTPLQLTALYNCLASEGTYYEPSFINQVELQDGTIIKKQKVNAKKILNTHETLIINHLLKSPFDKALASYTLPSLYNYQTNATFSAKTGSTSSTTWVMGYNKNYTIGVYFGNDDNLDLQAPQTAKILFQEIANELSKNTNEAFYQPDENMKAITFNNSLNNLTSKTYYI